MNLKDQRRYRVFLDESYNHETEPGKEVEKWRFYELRGRFGVVYPYSKTSLALLLTAMKIARPLQKAKKWPVIQAGDSEVVFLVPDAEWGQAAVLARAKNDLYTARNGLKPFQSECLRYARRWKMVQMPR